MAGHGGGIVTAGNGRVVGFGSESSTTECFGYSGSYVMCKGRCAGNGGGNCALCLRGSVIWSPGGCQRARNVGGNLVVCGSTSLQREETFGELLAGWAVKAGPARAPRGVE